MSSARSRSSSCALLGACGLFVSTNLIGQSSASCQPEAAAAADEDEWKFPDRKEFDMYLDKPKRTDLIKLFNAHNRGLAVWPWIWTQPNDNGPHHVIVGSVSIDVLERIKRIKETIPNVNLLVITDRESVQSLPEGEESLYRYECGLVLDTPVTLSDHKNKILMLEDERVVNYTKLYEYGERVE